LRYRKLSPTGDYTFGSGLLDFYIDVPLAPGQAAQTGLELIEGEWFLDTTAGTPYFAGVLGKFTQATADIIIRDQILNTQGVTGIAVFQSDLDTVKRVYTATATIDTIYGQEVVGFNSASQIPVFPILNNELITQSGFVLTTQQGVAITR
jgi:hypothetical protein